MYFITGKNTFSTLVVILFVVNLALKVTCQRTSNINEGNGAREKRGAAYAGSHPGGGGGYGQGGVGIPGINNALQYSAYNTLLNRNSHGGGGGGGGGYGGSSHGRKLTVDQAIGMYGHHTQNNQSPYTGGHDSGSGGGRHGGSSRSGGGGGGGGGGSYGR